MTDAEILKLAKGTYCIEASSETSFKKFDVILFARDIEERSRNEDAQTESATPAGQATPAEYEAAIETLRHVIECLRKNGSFTDEEGEATDFLEPLLSARATPADQDDLEFEAKNLEQIAKAGERVLSEIVVSTLRDTAMRIRETRATPADQESAKDRERMAYKRISLRVMAEDRAEKASGLSKTIIEVLDYLDQIDPLDAPKPMFLTATPADQAIAAMRDELLEMAKAASTESSPLRWAAFGHFAERVVRLAEDHKRITTHGE